MGRPVTVAQSVFLPRSGLSTTPTPGTPRLQGEAFRAGVGEQPSAWGAKEGVPPPPESRGRKVEQVQRQREAGPRGLTGARSDGGEGEEAALSGGGANTSYPSTPHPDGGPGPAAGHFPR